MQRIKAVCNGCGFCSAVCPAGQPGHGTGSVPLRPHELVRQLKYGLTEPVSTVLAALSCGGCRVCDDICPLDLQPGVLVTEVKRRLDGSLLGKDAA